VNEEEIFEDGDEEEVESSDDYDEEDDDWLQKATKLLDFSIF